MSCFVVMNGSIPELPSLLTNSLKLLARKVYPSLDGVKYLGFFDGLPEAIVVDKER